MTQKIVSASPSDRSPSVQSDAEEIEFEADPLPVSIKALAFIGLTFVGFGGWALTAPIDSAVIAPGRIVVDGGRQKIQHLEGGTVLEMMVDDGDRVERGDLLLRLDPTRAEAARSIVESGYIGAKAEEARLLAELHDDPDITFDPTLLTHAEQPDVRRILEAQRDVFASHQELRRRKIDVLEVKIQQLLNEITGLQAEHRSTLRQRELLTAELANLRILLAEGLTVSTQVLSLERDQERLRGDRLRIEAQIAKAKNQISEIEGQIALEQGDAHNTLSEELEQAQLTVIRTREELVGAEDVARRVEIRAPVDGLIVGNDVVTENGVVAPGQSIMEVVPTEKLLVIDVDLSVQDVDSVQIGQTAEVMLTAFNQATTPTLSGRVDHVAADRKVDETTAQPFFPAKIIVPKAELERLEDDQDLRPGMPADAVIVTGERTVFDYLMKPVAQSLARSWREE